MARELHNRIADNLRQRRAKSKLSRMEVAGRANIHFTYYSQIERAVRKDISVRILLKITKAMSMGLDEAVG